MPTYARHQLLWSSYADTPSHVPILNKLRFLFTHLRPQENICHQVQEQRDRFLKLYKEAYGQNGDKGIAQRFENYMATKEVYDTFDGTGTLFCGEETRLAFLKRLEELEGQSSGILLAMENLGLSIAELNWKWKVHKKVFGVEDGCSAIPDYVAAYGLPSAPRIDERPRIKNEVSVKREKGVKVQGILKYYEGINKKTKNQVARAKIAASDQRLQHIDSSQGNTESVVDSESEDQKVDSVERMLVTSRDSESEDDKSTPKLFANDAIQSFGMNLRQNGILKVDLLLKIPGWILDMLFCLRSL
jgi:hypothetical protein